MPKFRGKNGEFFLHRAGRAFAVVMAPGGLWSGITLFLDGGAQAQFEVEGTTDTVTKLLLDDDKTPGLSPLALPKM